MNMRRADRDELRYLAALVRAWAERVPAPGEPAPEPRPVTPPPGLDQDRFLRLFTSHTAAPALAPYLDPSALPAESWDRFVRALSLARQRSTWMLLEMERVLPALTAAGCRPLVLKGAALAVTVYPRPEDRWFADLDVLVDAGSRRTAYEALADLSYRFSDTRLAARYYEDHHFHRILTNLAGSCLEVHWAVTLPASVYSYDLEAMRQAAQTVRFGSQAAQVPSHGDQILLSVLQNIAGGFSDVRRILDLHLLDSRLDEADRAELVRRAGLHNLTTGLWLQYRVREALIGVPIPDPVAACSPAARERRWLAGLDVPAGCLSQRVRWNEGYDILLHWLCTPQRRRGRELKRFVMPDTGRLLEAGWRPEDLPRLGRRWLLSLRRLITAGRAFGYLSRAQVAGRPG